MKNLYACILLIISLPAFVNAQIITTIAGNDSAGYKGDGLYASYALLNDPMGIMVDKSGEIYIADAGNKRIRKIDVYGDMHTIAGNGKFSHTGDGNTATSASICTPVCIKSDISGNLYFAEDSGTISGLHFGWVRKIDKDGIITTIAGNGMAGYGGDGGPATLAKFNSISDLALDKKGNIYVADNLNKRIRRIGIDGIITTIAGDGSGYYNGEGISATSAGLLNIAGIAFDNHENLFISDLGNRRIRKVDSTGIITTVAGNGSFDYTGDYGPATNAGVYDPMNIAIDSEGNIFFGDYFFNRIRKVSSAGIITTIAGTGVIGNNGDDGPALEARLTTPIGIAVDGRGNIYFSNRYANSIRKIWSPSVRSNAYNHNNDNINIQPNPTTGELFIKSPDKVSVKVYNIVGQLVTQGVNTDRISIASFPAGMYLVKLYDEQGTVIKQNKIVKQ